MEKAGWDIRVFDSKELGTLLPLGGSRSLFLRMREDGVDQPALYGLTRRVDLLRRWMPFNDPNVEFEVPAPIPVSKDLHIVRDCLFMSFVITEIPHVDVPLRVEGRRHQVVGVQCHKAGAISGKQRVRGAFANGISVDRSS